MSYDYMIRMLCSCVGGVYCDPGRKSESCKHIVSFPIKVSLATLIHVEGVVFAVKHGVLVNTTNVF